MLLALSYEALATGKQDTDGIPEADILGSLPDVKTDGGFAFPCIFTINLYHPVLDLQAGEMGKQGRVGIYLHLQKRVRYLARCKLTIFRKLRLEGRNVQGRSHIRTFHLELCRDAGIVVDLNQVTDPATLF